MLDVDITNVWTRLKLLCDIGLFVENLNLRQVKDREKSRMRLQTATDFTMAIDYDK